MYSQAKRAVNFVAEWRDDRRGEGFLHKLFILAVQRLVVVSHVLRLPCDGDAIREAGKQVLDLAGARRVLEATREEQLSEFLHHRPQRTCAGILDR